MLRWLSKPSLRTDDPSLANNSASASPSISDDPLSLPLFNLTGEADGDFTIRNACTGVGIFGGTGSGKTSGSGALLAASYLRAGFGGLVLTVKPEDLEQWQRWALATDRQDDLIVFSPNSPTHDDPRFDFILYEQSRGGDGAGRTDNIVDMIMTAADIASGNIGASQSGDMGFWRDAAKTLLTNAVELLNSVGDEVTLVNIMSVIDTAPTSPKDERSEEWFKKSYCA